MIDDVQQLELWYMSIVALLIVAVSLSSEMSLECEGHMFVGQEDPILFIRILECYIVGSVSRTIVLSGKECGYSWVGIVS